MRSSFAEYRLGDVAQFAYGKMPKKELLGSGPYPTFSGYKYQYNYPEFNCEKGDVIVVARGVGGTGDVKIVEERSYLTNLAIKINLDDRKVHGKYFYYLHLNAGLRHLDSGSAQSQITINDLKNVSISVPPIYTQRAIAHILGTLDDKVELNRRMNETLEAIARAVFKSWFVDFDPVRAKASGEPPESICRRLGLTPDLLALFPDRLVDSELGEIPVGWGTGILGDVAEHPRRGIQPKQISHNTPYIALEHMPRRCIALSEWGAADGVESNKFEFKKGEFLFGKLRPYFHKVGVAPVDGVCSTDIVVIAPTSVEWFGFVLGHVSSDAFVDHANAGSTGTKMPRTNWVDMSRYAMTVPPKSVAEAFTSLIHPMIDYIHSAIYKTQTLTDIRDTLLPKLVSGEIRV